MLPPALNIPKWLKKNAHLLKPPVSNYCVYHPSSKATQGYTVMVVGGPNARTDYHINSTPEFFYQHKGSIVIKVVDTSTSPPTFQDIPVHEGSLYLLPPNTPHSPVRFADTVGVVLEVPRPKGAKDTLRWYCRECKSVVWEKSFVCTDLGTQLNGIIEDFAGDESKRECKKCGCLAPVRYGDGEVPQPPRFLEDDD
ncbi:3-hydroxyanthranilate 3,4-dioxygenase [Trichophyton mentagrophytes]|uniref:3-hydroxyanthranilate 3,4-dioxygenase n=3 Tax=Trichophyton TaxID=5550 RepID=A0A059IXG2_TRIIM|nr:3-hydroxyanthranilate 3,4-dioxygenase [Trichophyton tonsurans CBS 112818]EGE01085.1 3-hydroxyanthranilate 3,4-dioxygenase [Trichophyton equinum CBS 127.97]EZF28178.1 3-hydroxyanthranilate 3,4-dioxygenase [Trichophyton interdigitale H6]KDB20321.1 3-hydroxyanthranilate 3,4-dioxygenase [Trichophyton interdigitale MR816]GBF63160.1 3-hydroxyanthranilate 3,4-dioxygenase [Trichophyton mentagrophytes]